MSLLQGESEPAKELAPLLAKEQKNINMSLLQGAPEQPNLPEITKTTLPLLSTVLAGFAVTIIASLFSESKKNLAYPPANPGLFWGLVILAVSVPLFLSSAIYAVWGQAYNYQYLLKEVRELLNIKDEDVADYILRLHNKWYGWHRAANVTFYLGVITFFASVDILLWIFVGFVAGITFLVVGVILFCWGFLHRVRGKG